MMLLLIPAASSIALYKPLAWLSAWYIACMIGGRTAIFLTGVHRGREQIS